MKPFDIFRPGTHTDSAGVVASFGEDRLQRMAEVYDPALHEAPIVVGHPTSDGPAYGWVGAVAFVEGALVASPHQVDPEFAGMVSAGRFKTRSASFYEPGSPHNPVPGEYYLRHVGFLGAQPPAVKGLKPVEFAAGDEEGVVTVEFGEVDSWALARAFRAIRDFLIDEFGSEKADKALPDYYVDSIQDSAARSDAAASPSFTEHPEDTTEEEPGMSDKDAKAAADKLAAREAEIVADRKKLDAERAAFAESAALTASTAYVGGLVEKGKVLPAERDTVAALLARLDGGATLSFGEGDGRTEKAPQAAFREFLEALPDRVDFAERSKDTGADDVEADPRKVAADAVAYQEEMRGKGVVVDTDAAVRHVIAKQKG